MGTDPNSQKRALVVDDEVELAAVVAGYLERDGYAVTIAHDGEAAVELARELQPTVVILDLGLPRLDGVEACRQIRTFSDCYILMLTARVDEVDKLIGLSIGADDYVTKPFSPRELMARVAVLQRRPRTAVVPDSPDEVLHFGELSIDVLGREVHVSGNVVDLTRTEFDLLTALATSPRRAFSRKSLIEAVWGDEWMTDDHLVDVHILHVRQKLGDTAAAQKYVRTIRGVGYRMGTGE